MSNGSSQGRGNTSESRLRKTDQAHNMASEDDNNSDGDLHLSISDLEMGEPPTVTIETRTAGVTQVKRPASTSAAATTRSKKLCKAKEKPTSKGPTRGRPRSKKPPMSELSEEEDEDDDDRYQPGPSRGRVGTNAYQDGIYARLDAIAAKIDTLVNVIADSTRQVKLLTETVCLQQTRIESIQTSVTKSVTQTPRLYPSLSTSAPVAHAPVTHTFWLKK